ncbi:hypothetical protein OURE66S_03473 [Oligella ureolytica]
MHVSAKLMALGDIATIRSGFTFREKVDELASSGNARVAQIKDVRNEWETTQSALLKANHLPMIQWEGKDKAFVDSGTVLLPSRGSKGGYFRASFLLLDSTSELPVVVSSQFLVLTAKPEVLPEFLCWSLNQPDIQYLLSEGMSQGSSIVMLNTANAAAIQIKVPPLAIQHKVVRLNELWEQEQQLTQKLLRNRERMLQGMYQHLLMEKL